MFERIKYVVQGDIEHGGWPDYFEEGLKVELNNLDFMEYRYERYRKDSEILEALKCEGIELTDIWNRAHKRLEEK